MDSQIVKMVRAMIAEGMSDADIAGSLAEMEAESAASEREQEMAFGNDDDPYEGYTFAQRCQSDRLSLGRNDAGEWLGFM
jgi:hypothetical protein